MEHEQQSQGFEMPAWNIIRDVGKSSIMGSRDATFFWLVSDVLNEIVLSFTVEVPDEELDTWQREEIKKGLKEMRTGKLVEHSDVVKRWSAW